MDAGPIVLVCVTAAVDETDVYVLTGNFERREVDLFRNNNHNCADAQVVGHRAISYSWVAPTFG